MKLQVSPQFRNLLLLTLAGAFALQGVAWAVDYAPSGTKHDLNTGDRIWNISAGAMTQSGDLDLKGNAILGGGTSAATVLVSGKISGGGGLTITGTTVTLSDAANTYRGVTVISSGATLISMGERALGAKAGVTINSGGVLQLGYSGVLDEDLYGAGTLRLTMDAILTGNLTSFAGTIDMGSNPNTDLTLRLNNLSPTFNSTITGAGNLHVDSNSNVTLGASTNINVSDIVLSPGNSRGTITQNGGTVTANTLVTSGGTATGAYTLAEGVLNVNQLIINGTTGSTRGTFTMTGGELNIGAGGITNAAGSTATTNVRLGNGTVTASADWRTTLALTLGVNNSGDVTTFDTELGREVRLSGSISGTGGLTKTGAGTLTLETVNTYSGATIVSSGTLAVTNAAGLSGTASIYVASDANLSVTDATNSFTHYRPFTNAGTVELNVLSNVSVVNTGSMEVLTAGSTVNAMAGSTGSFTLGAGVTMGINVNQSATKLTLESLSVTRGDNLTGTILKFDIGTSLTNHDSLAVTNFEFLGTTGTVILQVNAFEGTLAAGTYYLISGIDLTGLGGTFTLVGLPTSAGTGSTGLKYSSGADDTGYYFTVSEGTRGILWSGESANWNMSDETWQFTSADDTHFYSSDAVQFGIGTDTITVTEGVNPGQILVTTGNHTLRASGDGEIGTSSGCETITTQINVTGGVLTLDGSLDNKVNISGAVNITSGIINMQATDGLGTGAINLHAGGVLNVASDLANSQIAFNGGNLNFTATATISGRLVAVGSNTPVVNVADGVVGTMTASYTQTSAFALTGDGTFKVTNAKLYGGVSVTDATLVMEAHSGLGGLLTLQNGKVELATGTAISSITGIHVLAGESTIDFHGRTDTFNNLKLGSLSLAESATITLQNANLVNMNNIAPGDGVVQVKNFHVSGTWTTSNDLTMLGNNTVGTQLTVTGGTTTVVDNLVAERSSAVLVNSNNSGGSVQFVGDGKMQAGHDLGTGAPIATVTFDGDGTFIHRLEMQDDYTLSEESRLIVSHYAGSSSLEVADTGQHVILSDLNLELTAEVTVQAGTKAELTGTIQGVQGVGNEIMLGVSTQGSSGGTISVHDATLRDINIHAESAISMSNVVITGNTTITANQNVTLTGTITEVIGVSASSSVYSTLEESLNNQLDLSAVFAGDASFNMASLSTFNVDLSLVDTSSFVDGGYLTINMFDAGPSGNIANASPARFRTNTAGWVVDQAATEALWAGGHEGSVAFQFQYIPEPTSTTLGVLGIASLLLRRRRKA